MLSSRISALTAGNRRNASTAALAKNDMKPSLTPCFSWNASLYRFRISITGCMLTSLNVVNSAAVCWASTSRAAMVRRSMLIGLTSSARNDVSVTSEAGAAGRERAVIAEAGAGDEADRAAPPVGRLRMKAWTSSFNRRPPGPVAGTWSAPIPCSSSSRWAAGITNPPPREGADGADLPAPPDRSRPFEGADLCEGACADPRGRSSVVSDDEPDDPRLEEAPSAGVEAGRPSEAPRSVDAWSSADGSSEEAPPDEAPPDEAWDADEPVDADPPESAGGSPGRISPITSPTSANSSSGFEIDSSTPEAGEGIWTDAFSVSISTRSSPSRTHSPSCFNQRPICTSVIDSPTPGTSTLMLSLTTAFAQTVRGHGGG